MELLELVFEMTEQELAQQMEGFQLPPDVARMLSQQTKGQRR